ncbi:hypothetical protein [Nocardiopsis aegyptia]|uniref:Uncharacterized protein n=1 Tax=Nocardiopsis aegyptia TaxID=220378 RepID=A0A7Z0JC55_9ACTN|nr:hypothetical protein [Nocardiopsis aegyptia]NYJ36124.1 hypothetical protein [Nocardiopsis aegyptia]
MTVHEVRELPDMRSLRSWARAHNTRIRYLGPTLDRHAVYAAEDGDTARVVRTPEHDPHPPPLVWRSPLERLRPVV